MKGYKEKNISFSEEELLKEIKEETSYFGAKNAEGNIYEQTRTTDADEEYLKRKIQSAWRKVMVKLQEFRNVLPGWEGGMELRCAQPVMMPDEAWEEMVDAAREYIVMSVISEWMVNINVQMAQLYEQRAEKENDRMLHARVQRYHQKDRRLRPF